MPRRHSPEDIERGLTALVIAGSSTRASEVTGISENTLRAWKREHRERYEKIRHEREGDVAKMIAAEAELLTQKVFDIEHKILDSFGDEDIASLKPADKASTLRNLQTVAALGVDKLSSPLRERPSHVQHTQTPDELLSRLARAMGFDATSTAEEIPADADDRPALTPESNDLNARELGA